MVSRYSGTMTEIILSNVKKLYDGSAADASAVHIGADLHIEGGKITQLRPHDPAARSTDV